MTGNTIYEKNFNMIHYMTPNNMTQNSMPDMTNPAQKGLSNLFLTMGGTVCSGASISGAAPVFLAIPVPRLF